MSLGAGKYYFNLGALLLETGQGDAAAEQFKHAIDADPNYAEAQYQYGMALVAKATLASNGKMVAPPGTLEAFRKYLALAPKGPNAQSAKDMIAALGNQ